MADEWNMSTEHSWIEDDKANQNTVRNPVPESPCTP